MCLISCDSCVGVVSFDFDLDHEELRLFSSFFLVEDLPCYGIFAPALAHHSVLLQLFEARLQSESRPPHVSSLHLGPLGSLIASILGECKETLENHLALPVFPQVPRFLCWHCSESIEGHFQSSLFLLPSKSATFGFKTPLHQDSMHPVALELPLRPTKPFLLLAEYSSHIAED